jgi:hypothetical protein
VRPESQQNPSAKLNFIRDIAPVAAIIRVPLVVVASVDQFGGPRQQCAAE